SQKPYCTARQCLNAGQAFQAVLREGVDPAAVTAIRVRVAPAYAAMIGRQPEAGSRSAPIRRAAVPLAVLALPPQDRFPAEGEALENNETLRRYAARVSVVADPALAQFYPERWPAEIEVDTAGGTVSKRVVDAHGDPTRHFSEAELIDKAHSVLAPT